MASEVVSTLCEACLNSAQTPFVSWPATYERQAATYERQAEEAEEMASLSITDPAHPWKTILSKVSQRLAQPTVLPRWNSSWHGPRGGWVRPALPRPRPALVARGRRIEAELPQVLNLLALALSLLGLKDAFSRRSRPSSCSRESPGGRPGEAVNVWRAPWSRCLRRSEINDEYKPSRRSSAPLPSRSRRSYSARILSLYCAL